jgi:hypothetical protein
MAADDELPRGWTLSQGYFPGQLPSLTLPAIPNVAHVLTVVNFSSVITAAGVAFNAYALVITSFAPTFALFYQGVISNEAPGTVLGGGWTGKIAAPIGHALTVASNVVVGGGINSQLNIQGYDI